VPRPHARLPGRRGARPRAPFPPGLALHGARPSRRRGRAARLAPAPFPGDAAIACGSAQQGRAAARRPGKARGPLRVLLFASAATGPGVPAAEGAMDAVPAGIDRAARDAFVPTRPDGLLGWVHEPDRRDRDLFGKGIGWSTDALGSRATGDAG